MAEQEQIPTIARSKGGKHSNRRLRYAGQTPAVLYGHGEANVCLSVPSEALAAALRHGSRMVGLTGAVNESAFIRDLQWDTYGTHVLHVDFTRISVDELVKVHLTVELRGQAPGVKEGGAVEQLVHDVQIECPAGAIPEKLYVNINQLKLNDTIAFSQLELPAKVEGFRRSGNDRGAVHRPGREAGGTRGRRGRRGRTGGDRCQEGRGRGGRGVTRLLIAIAWGARHETCRWAGQSWAAV